MKYCTVYRGGILLRVPIVASMIAMTSTTLKSLCTKMKIRQTCTMWKFAFYKFSRYQILNLARIGARRNIRMFANATKLNNLPFHKTIAAKFITAEQLNKFSIIETTKWLNVRYLLIFNHVWNRSIALYIFFLFILTYRRSFNFRVHEC